MSAAATIPKDDTISSSAQGTPTPTGIPYADAPPQNAQSQPQQQPPAAAAKPETGSWDYAAQNPGMTEQESSEAQGPLTFTTNKPAGLLGVMHSITDALVGKTTPVIATDNQGNKYIQQVDMTGQQQWKRLGGEILSGAAAGLAAGQGAGNMGKAAQAGILAEQQQQQQRQKEWDSMSADARQENMDRANRVMQNMQIAKTSWELTNAQHKSAEDTIKFSNDEVDRYQKMGGQVLGVAKDYGDIAHILKQDPEAVHNMIVKGDIVTVPAFDENGNRHGTTFVKLPNGWAKQMLPSGAEFKAWNGQTHQLETRKASDGMTTGEQELLNNAAVLQQQQWQQETVKQEQTAQAAKDKTALTNSEITRNSAMANHENAQAGEARSRAQNATAANSSDNVAIDGEKVAHGMLGLEELDTKKRSAVIDYLAKNHPDLDQRSVTANAQERRTSDLANNALHNLSSIEAALKTDPKLSGHINGLLSQGKTLVGTDDPRLTEINTALDNYALASTGAHGVRAVSAREDAKKALLNHLRNGPQGVQAGINQARSSLMNLAQLGKPKREDGSPYVLQSKSQNPVALKAPTPTKPAPAGATLMVPDKEGKNWYWVDAQKKNLGPVQ